MYRITLDKEDFLRYQLFTVSQSKRMKNKRIRNWILLTTSFLLLGLALWQDADNFFSYYFFGCSIITLIFYPVYHRWLYKRHFQKHIEENYKTRVGIESELGFDNEYIISKADSQEGKVKLTQIQEINEISENLFIKLQTGESMIVPTGNPDFSKLKDELKGITTTISIPWNYQPDWRWK